MGLNGVGVTNRVLMIAGNYPPYIAGGGEIFTQMMASGLADLGVEVRVLSCANVPENKVDGRVEVEFIQSPNIYWRFGGSRSTGEKAIWHLLENYNPQTIRTLRWHLRDFKPEVVVTSVLENFGAAAWLAARSVHIPVVDVIQSYYLQCIKGSRFKNGVNCPSRCIECRLATYGKKYLSRYVQGVIGVSQHVLEAHTSLGYFPNAHQTFIYNPVDNRVQQPRSRYRSARPTFGYLGKLLPTKGIEELIGAISTSELRPRLLIAGDGDPVFESLLRKRARHDQVTFLGWVNPAELFEQIDFLIFPSMWNEPFGRGIAEAMSQGIPVIGARRGAIPELIEPGADGFLYDPSSMADFHRTLKVASDSDYKHLSQNALDKSTLFDKQNIINKFLEFIVRIVAEHRRQAA